MSTGLEDFSLFDLFRLEAEEQVRVLQAELLRVEGGDLAPAALETLMRAAHSLKGAARIVGLNPIVDLTHAMEDRFVAAQNGQPLISTDVDFLLMGVDWLAQLQQLTEADVPAWIEENGAAIQAFAVSISTAANKLAGLMPSVPAAPPSIPSLPPATTVDDQARNIFAPDRPAVRSIDDRTVRISAHRFDQILSLASETLVASRNLAARGALLERSQRSLASALQLLEDRDAAPEARTAAWRELERQSASVAISLAELDSASRANERTAERIYRTVLAGRLRPFSEGIAFAMRLVRDTARDLGKQVSLEVVGERTRVDRDILERLESPLSHLISNAIDHGIEKPEDRINAAKLPEARLRLHARHENGRLVITLRDDGRGISIEKVRERAIQNGLLESTTAEHLSERELFEFLFLPGFSTREEVSSISGRGVGLNVVQAMVQEAGGSVTVSSEPGVGTTFRLTLPVTRSVIKVIRIKVQGESYAIPLVRIDRVAHMEPAMMSVPDASDADTPQLRISLSGAARDETSHASASIAERTLPVVTLASLLGLSNLPPPSGSIPLLISAGIAFAVDRLVDEVELPVRHLDQRLGKIPGVSAASLDENGLPILILDMEDLVQTALGKPLNPADAPHRDHLAPHVLIVDDSHTVREIERRLLAKAGYHVTTAQNGAEAWNLLRLNEYDLLISDVDMPQMNGIELVTRLRENARLGRMPVIILSYKDREEDRKRGLEAGADFYLTKGDFENDRFLQAVVDLIGEAAPPIS